MTMQERIKQLRKNKNLTQGELASLAGVSKTAVYNWERGSYAPEGENLRKLAEALDTTVAYLLGETPFWPKFADIPEHKRTVEQLNSIIDQVSRQREATYNTTLAMGRYSDPEIGIIKILDDLTLMQRATKKNKNFYQECDARMLIAYINSYKNIVEMVYKMRPWKDIHRSLLSTDTTQGRIKQLRKNKNLTQGELADLVGVTKGAVYSWERGNYLPEGIKLKNLVEALGTTVDYLLCETDENPAGTPFEQKNPLHEEATEKHSTVPEESLSRYEDPDVGIYEILGDMLKMQESSKCNYKHYQENYVNMLDALLNAYKKLVADICTEQPWKNQATRKI